MFKINCYLFQQLKPFVRRRNYSQKLHFHVNLFKKYFGIKTDEAIKYAKHNRLDRIEDYQLENTIKFCLEIGFKSKELIKIPMLLRTNSILIEQRYRLMEECKMKVLPEVIAKFRTYYKLTVENFKTLGLLTKDTNVAEEFIKHLDPCPEGFYVPSSEDQQWNVIHQNITCEYLKWRLHASQADMEELFRVHFAIKRKSFRFLCENIKIAEELGFEPRKILKYGYILASYPKYTIETLDKYPNLCGYDMRKAMRMYPKLVQTAPYNIEKIYKILKSYKIPNSTIQKRMNIFHLSPETVEDRLRAISKNDDLKILMNNPQVLKLVVHHNRAQTRLKSLKDLHLKCAGVHLLGNDGGLFDIHVKDGRDRLVSSDVRFLLEDLLKVNSDKFWNKFRMHPNYLNIPLGAIDASFNWLIDHDFSRDSIAEAVSIVLYSPEKLEKARNKTANFQYIRNGSTFTEANTLNLMLYFMEKEFHFTGNGVWDQAEEMVY